MSMNSKTHRHENGQRRGVAAINMMFRMPETRPAMRKDDDRTYNIIAASNSSNIPVLNFTAILRFH